MLTNAGGLGILCADACEAAGLELPELSEETRAALQPLLPDDASVANPVDLLGSATGATFESVFPALLDDQRLDALIVLFVPPVVAGAEEVATAIHDAVGPRRHRQAGARGLISAGRDARSATRRRQRRRLVRLPRVGRARARARGGARGMASTTCRRGPRRSRFDTPTTRAPRRGRSRRARRGLARCRPDPRPAHGLRHPARPRASWRRARTRPWRRRPSSASRSSLKTAAAGAHKTEQGGVALDLRDEAAGSRPQPSGSGRRCSSSRW